MALVNNEIISFDEYIKLRENSDSLYEYIDGIVYMSPSPSIKHQRVSSRLHGTFYNYLKGKYCEVFHAPIDIELKKDGVNGTKIVIPDITIICDKSGFNNNKYMGVPTLIVEILSPSNQSHDLITKLNLYMKYGVKEYWIVNPLNNSVTVYNLNEEEMYEQSIVKAERGILESVIFKNLTVDLEELFE